jgi:hypothetical protein
MRFDFKKIYVQRAIYEDLIWRQNAENIINRFPSAETVEVESQFLNFLKLIRVIG